MPRDILHLAVFCGSSQGTPQVLALAQDLGARMADEKIVLVYGGGKHGVMGALAGAVLANGGRAVGVITEQLKGRELAHPGLSMLHTVPDMARRKDMMLFLADAMLALPGGLGTLDEVTEVLAYRQLALHEKPLCLVNQDGFFDGLVAQLDRAKRDGFIHGGKEALPLVARDLDQALELLRA